MGETTFDSIVSMISNVFVDGVMSVTSSLLGGSGLSLTGPALFRDHISVLGRASLGFVQTASVRSSFARIGNKRVELP